MAIKADRVREIFKGLEGGNGAAFFEHVADDGRLDGNGHSPARVAYPGICYLHVQVVARTPLGRLGTTSDVADVVAFLASPDARWVTGQVVEASGGINP